MKKYISEAVIKVGGEIEESTFSYSAFRKKKQRIDLKKYGHVIYLKKGIISVYTDPSDLLTGSISSPAILGLVGLHYKETYYYLRCETPCEMVIISHEEAANLFTRNTLWEYAFNICNDFFYNYLRGSKTQSSRKVKDIVTEHLKDIWSMESTQREKVSIYKFILSRNQVSRSAIHKVIKDLCESGKAVVSRARLIDFDAT